MRRTKYILHPSLEFIDLHEVQSLDTNFTFKLEISQKIKQKEVFVLSNKRRTSVFFINPTIKIFLEAFKTPQFLSDVLTSFAASIESTVEEAEPIVTSFFDDMCDRDILISNLMAHKIVKLNPPKVYQEGDTIDDYRIIRPLSISRFLHVYLGEKDKNKVVLKMIVLPDDMSDKGVSYYKRLFNQEFELIKEVGDNENICRLIDWQVEKNYAVLEYIEGQSVLKLSDKPDLNLSQCLHVFHQVLKSIATLHQKRILHGDIHASNFLVTNNFEVKLIDFDLANHEHLMRFEVELEGGIHEYIAPEKIDENSFDMVKERSDYTSEVYQLGIILYLLLFKNLPFKALTWHELSSKIMNDEPDFKIKKIENNATDPNIEETIPLKIIDFLKKCILKNPKHRFVNASSALEYWESEIFAEQESFK